MTITATSPTRNAAPRSAPSNLVREHQDEILAKWVTAIRECTPASRLDDEGVRDHGLLLLSCLADAVDAIAAGRWRDIPSEGALRHALDRLGAGFDLKQVVTELFLLRHVLLELLWERGPPMGGRLREVQDVSWALDAAIRESVEAYTFARQRTLEALDRLSTAAMQSTCLDELLPRLLRVVADTTADVDSAALFLLDRGQLRLRAAVGLEQGLEPGDGIELGQGLVGRVAAERRPILFTITADDAVAEHRLLEERGIRALYGLPLVAEGELLGVLHMASVTVSDFSDRDKALLRVIADRAGAAILQQLARQQAAGAARRRDEALALLDSVYAGAPIGLAFLDRDLRCVRVNRALAEMNGLPPEAHLGRRCSEILPGLVAVHDVEAAWHRILQTGQPMLDVETSGQSPAAPGEQRHRIESWYPVRVQGEVVGIGVVVRDITQQRLSEELQRHVLGVVSHDMRTPLTTIKLSAEVLARDASVLARHGPTVARMRRNAVRLQRLVGDLLDFTRVRAGQGLPVDPGPTDLVVLCHEVVAEAQAAHPERRLALECSDDCRGDWDGSRLAQALANLVGNACTHSPPGAAISVRCHGERDRARVEVENQGPPISVALQDHMFEPFRRGGTAHNSSERGYGLGLFITREIIRAHGGAISLESNERRTVFRFSLPRQAR